MVTNALDIYGNWLEQRFAKSKIKKMMKASDLEHIVFLRSQFIGLLG